jgi:hypothetical protein
MKAQRVVFGALLVIAFSGSAVSAPSGGGGGGGKSKKTTPAPIAAYDANGVLIGRMTSDLYRFLVSFDNGLYDAKIEPVPGSDPPAWAIFSDIVVYFELPDCAGSMYTLGGPSRGNWGEIYHGIIYKDGSSYLVAEGAWVEVTIASYIPRGSSCDCFNVDVTDPVLVRLVTLGTKLPFVSPFTLK